MRWQIQPDHPLRRLFGGLVENVFQAELGICDPALTDYLTRLLSEFVHIDAIYRLRTVDGGVIREVSCAEADAYLGPHVNPTERRRVVNRFIGDFTLFWTGVYPETLSPRHGGVSRLNEYLLHGRRSYGIASELSQGDAEPPGRLLRRLSEEFESCVHGLHLVRESWEQLDLDARHN